MKEGGDFFYMDLWGGDTFIVYERFAGPLKDVPKFERNNPWFDPLG